MRGFDLLTATINSSDSTSLLIPVAKIPRYTDDNLYTQGHRYCFEVVELNSNMRTTRFNIYTANSANTVKCYYDGTPHIKIVVDGKSSNELTVYVKPNLAYGCPIGVNITAENPSTIIPLAGQKPIMDESNLSPVRFEFKPFDFIIHNSITLPTIQDVTNLLKSTGTTYDYKVAYNLFSNDGDHKILPTDIWAMWFVTHTVGHTSGTNTFAIQKWECVKDGAYKCYVRSRENNTAWGAFINIS